MANTYDVIIAGLGAMGSAVAYHASKRGQRVLGLEQFIPPHAFGSSHGQTRIIREAYFEDPVYVPLVQRAYGLWANLERESGRTLLLPTGGVMIGPPDGLVVPGAKRSADLHHLPYEHLSADAIHHRFPVLHPEPSMEGIWEPRAGILFPEECILAHLNLAGKQGASLHYEEPITAWHPEGQGVRVITSKSSYLADQLILSAGTWLPTLWPDCPMPLTVERQVQYWFSPRRPLGFRKQHCPIHLWEYEPNRFFYGYPDLGDGVKVARHHEGVLTTPSTVDRTVSPAEMKSMHDLTLRFLPGLAAKAHATSVCCYTNSPDSHFLLDRLPGCPQVQVVSPCSGHGFKFSCAIGEWVSQRLLGESSPFDDRLFRLGDARQHRSSG